jgi:4-hydroxyphenylpyruvate dioxygenase
MISSVSQSKSDSIQGFESFTRSNPLTEKISSRTFHHIEFYCGDATNTYKRFQLGLGMSCVAKSDLSTGNTAHASYVLQSENMKMVFTAPYHSKRDNNGVTENMLSTVMPQFSKAKASEFFMRHGLGVYAVAISVDDVKKSFEILISNGAVEVTAPIEVEEAEMGFADIAEVELYGDVVLRLVNTDNYSGVFLPNFKSVLSSGKYFTETYGFTRFDHIVGNLWSLEPKYSQLKQMTVRFRNMR